MFCRRQLFFKGSAASSRSFKKFFNGYIKRFTGEGRGLANIDKNEVLTKCSKRGGGVKDLRPPYPLCTPMNIMNEYYEVLH